MSLSDFQSKEKEESTSSTGVESSCVPNEADYGTKVDSKPIPD